MIEVFYKYWFWVTVAFLGIGGVLLIISGIQDIIRKHRK